MARNQKLVRTIHDHFPNSIIEDHGYWWQIYLSRGCYAQEHPMIIDTGTTKPKFIFELLRVSLAIFDRPYDSGYSSLQLIANINSVLNTDFTIQDFRMMVKLYCGSDKHAELRRWVRYGLDKERLYAKYELYKQMKSI